MTHQRWQRWRRPTWKNSSALPIFCAFANAAIFVPLIPNILRLERLLFSLSMPLHFAFTFFFLHRPNRTNSTRTHTHTKQVYDTITCPIAWKKIVRQVCSTCCFYGEMALVMREFPRFKLSMVFAQPKKKKKTKKKTIKINDNCFRNGLQNRLKGSLDAMRCFGKNLMMLKKQQICKLQ